MVVIKSVTTPNLEILERRVVDYDVHDMLVAKIVINIRKREI